MDLPINMVNVGRIHQFPTQNDAEATRARAIRGVMIQKREAVKRIEDEITQLVENKRGQEEDLVRLGVELAPHNDRGVVYCMALVSSLHIPFAAARNLKNAVLEAERWTVRVTRHRFLRPRPPFLSLRWCQTQALVNARQVHVHSSLRRPALPHYGYLTAYATLPFRLASIPPEP